MTAPSFREHSPGAAHQAVHRRGGRSARSRSGSASWSRSRRVAQLLARAHRVRAAGAAKISSATSSSAACARARSSSWRAATSAPSRRPICASSSRPIRARPSSASRPCSRRRPDGTTRLTRGRLPDLRRHRLHRQARDRRPRPEAAPDGGLRPVAQFGPAWASQFANLYVVTPEGAVIMYWPGQPWALERERLGDLGQAEPLFDGANGAVAVVAGARRRRAAPSENGRALVGTLLRLRGQRLAGVGHPPGGAAAAAPALGRAGHPHARPDRTRRRRRSLRGTYNVLFSEDGPADRPSALHGGDPGAQRRAADRRDRAIRISSRSTSLASSASRPSRHRPQRAARRDRRHDEARAARAGPLRRCSRCRSRPRAPGRRRASSWSWARWRC